MDNRNSIVTGPNTDIQPLVADLRQIITTTRSRVATNVNAELTLMYWQIGERINREVLGNKRAEYGKQIVSAVSAQLQTEFGTGFELRTIRRMMQFASLFPDIQIVSTLLSQLSWSHFLLVMPIKDPMAREFYLTMAAARQIRHQGGAILDGVALKGNPPTPTAQEFGSSPRTMEGIID